MGKSKASTCRFNANRAVLKDVYPFCTWKPPEDWRFPPNVYMSGDNRPSEQQCSKCKCYTKDDA